MNFKSAQLQEQCVVSTNMCKVAWLVCSFKDKLNQKVELIPISLGAIRLSCLAMGRVNSMCVYRRPSYAFIAVHSSAN